jgi:hypothetical protein
VDVRFVRGLDRHSTYPSFVEAAGLNERFAVVQDTFVEGCDDMHFEEPLWRELVECFPRLIPDCQVLVTPEIQPDKPIMLGDFLQRWDLTAAEDREPPPIVTALSGQTIALVMVTDFWVRTGGPDIYHDSYTYSVFSEQDVSAELMATLHHSAARSRWNLATEVTPTGPPS